MKLSTAKLISNGLNGLRKESKTEKIITKNNTFLYGLAKVKTLLRRLKSIAFPVVDFDILYVIWIFYLS
jgi:hypothetical protein